MRKVLWLAVLAIFPVQIVHAKAPRDGFEYGIKFPIEAMERLKVNQTTVSQAWEMLGEPMRMVPQDNFVVCVYGNLTSRFKRKKGFLFSHQTHDIVSWGDMVVLLFDHSGKLVAYTWDQKRVKIDGKGNYAKDPAGNYLIDEKTVNEPIVTTGLGTAQLRDTQARAQANAESQQEAQNQAQAAALQAISTTQVQQLAAQQAALYAQQQAMQQAQMQAQIAQQAAFQAQQQAMNNQIQSQQNGIMPGPFNPGHR